MSRRGLLRASAAGLSVLPGWSGSNTPPSHDNKESKLNRLWYRQPAARWEEALPLGNGRLGAMVFGRVGQERLQLNEDTLWAGSPYTADNPDAAAALPQVRSLLAEGRYAEATELASQKVMSKPLNQMPYGSAGDLLLTFDQTQTPTQYERELDLDNALCSTHYRSADGEFLRESFASAPDHAIVLRMEAAQGRFGFALAYRGPRNAPSIAPDYTGTASPLVSEQATDWAQAEEIGPQRADLTFTEDGSGAWLITGRNEAVSGVPAGLRFALRVQVISDGKVSVAADGIRLRDAREATLLITLATSFVNARDVSADPVAIVRRQGERAARKSYAELKRDHLRAHQALFGGFSIELGRSAAADRPTDARIRAAETADDPALAALYCQYARYLMVSCSRPGTQPANLQGIWNEGTNPPWGSKYTININTEMNYWPADAAGLGACVEPLLKMVEELSVTGAKTARAMYGARGWVTHHNTDLWRATAPIDGPLWGLWPCGGAWLCNTLWDHYDYQRGHALLQRLYPLLKGASTFFLDTLIDDPQDRGLITSPSLSPENTHPFGSALCAGPAMDRQIVRDLFSHTAQAARELGLDAAFANQLDRARTRLAPDRIGAQGQLQEWLEDWDARAPEQHHRHVSHLYAVYPSGQINLRDTPELARAARTSLIQRGDLATGWGTAWRLCLWARLGEGEHAHAVLRALMGPQRSYPNLFDAHPPFQIDGNFGGAAGILEMLVQCWGGEILLLPALPPDWPSGHISGLKARGGITVNMAWQRGQVASLELHGPAGAKLRLRQGGAKGKLKEIQLDAQGRHQSAEQATT